MAAAATSHSFSSLAPLQQPPPLQPPIPPGALPPQPAHFHRERRRDLTPLKLAVFDAMADSAAAAAGAPGPGVTWRPPLCKLWAMYRKALRLFLLGELSKPELDAVVIYMLGQDKGAGHVMRDSARSLACVRQIGF